MPSAAEVLAGLGIFFIVLWLPLLAILFGGKLTVQREKVPTEKPRL
jgi:Na+-transporting methylmalonyl-CoA/oxaloacetate decarboxylase gamma subunit